MSADELRPPTGPSLKGTTFDSVLQDVRALRDAGTISNAQIEARLEAEDLAYLDEKVRPTGWYPIESYRRWLEFLCDVEGEGDPEGYLIRRGAIAADRLRASGLYPMLDAETDRIGLRALRLFITIAQAVYNFTQWSGELDEAKRRFTVTVDEAGDYPDVARLAAQGFLARGAEHVTGANVQVTSERAAADRVMFYFEIGE